MLARSKAISSGFTKYNTGKPCKYGHYSDRYVSTLNCVQCVKEHRKNTQLEINQGRQQLSMGFVEVIVKVKPDNAESIRDFAKIINSNDESLVKAVVDFCHALGLAIDLAGA